MTRLAIVAAAIATLLAALVIAMRVPAAEMWLEDLPVVGGVFDALASLLHTHHDGPTELRYRVDRPPNGEALAAIRRRVAPATVDLRDGTLVVTAASFSDALSATERLDRAWQWPTVRVFSVVYQSEELDRIKLALRKDDQANKLGLSVELDPIGYHLHAPSDLMMVNPAWAERHHCGGHHYEGTGTSCFVSARERVAAFVHGDAELFVDAHPDALALPTGRAFYATTEGDYYELEADAIEIPAAQIARAMENGTTLELTVAPTLMAALAARANAPTVELVAEITPGVLHPANLVGSMLAIDGAAEAADDLVIAGAGLHALR